MDRRIELVIAKLKTEPASAWDFAALSALVNLSPSRFRHLFKQETGTTPAQYLKEIRLRRAAKLLCHTFLTIKQIVKQVNLGSNAHFVRDFRKLYGMTPTVYRRTMGRNAKRHRRRKKKTSATHGKI
ncbi:MAG TPA: AraC family transcriptional regulator [Pyrinomonadaceae bacterium]|nr:AraC family transcriptional regulator [Pyrinomonadaceae bacterium]